MIKGKLKTQERKALLGFLDLLLCAVGTVDPDDLSRFMFAAVTRKRIQHLSELVGNASPAVRLQGVPSLGFLARMFEDWRVAPAQENYVWKCVEIVQLLRNPFGKYLQLSEEKKVVAKKPLSANQVRPILRTLLRASFLCEHYCVLCNVAASFLCAPTLLRPFVRT